MERELLLGEVTPEVAAFLESLGREAPPREHVYMGPPARVRYQSRHVFHQPHWKFLSKRYDPAPVSVELEVELGDRVANALRMQADTEAFFSTQPRRNSE